MFVKETVWNVFLDRFFFFVSIFFENNLFYASVTCEFLFSENHIRKYLSKVCIYDFIGKFKQLLKNRKKLAPFMYNKNEKLYIAA